MFFRRKRSRPEPEPERPEDKRRLYRAPVDSETIRATVVREGREPVQAGVVDLSLEGAGIAVPRHLDPGLEPGEVVALSLRHLGEGWVVETAACVEQSHHGGGANVKYGLTFLNTGSLYAQLEDRLGVYFNRRRHERVRPDLDKDVIVRLRQAGHRPRGPVYDISESGLCVSLDLVSSTALDPARPVGLSFELPGCKVPFEGQARLVARRRLRTREFVSLEFDLGAGGTLAERHRDLCAYVGKRSEQMRAFSAALQAAAAERE